MNNSLTGTLDVLNNLIIVCSPIFIIYAYNEYLSTKDLLLDAVHVICPFWKHWQ